MESPTKRAERLFLEGRCVYCGDKVEQLRLGLCQTHYMRYYRAIKGLSEEDRAAYDKRAIRDGELIPNRQGKRSREDNSYEKRLEKLKQSGVIRSGSEMPKPPPDDDLSPVPAPVGRKSTTKKKAAAPANRKAKSSDKRKQA
jgi:hypothetical protein